MNNAEAKNIDKKIDQTIAELTNHEKIESDELIDLLKEIKKYHSQSDLEPYFNYKEIFHNNPTPLAFFERSSDGKDFIIVDLNEACLKREIIEGENVIGKRVGDVFSTRLPAEASVILNEVWETGKDKTISYKLEDKGGTTLWFESRIFKIPSGKLLFSSFDITERKLIEENLRESEEKYKTLFDNPKLVMLVIDFKTQMIIDANRGAELFYGWTRDEFMKMNINRINVLPTEEIKKRMLEAKEKRLPYFEFVHRKKSGEKVCVAVYKGDNFIHGGKEIFYIIVLDISERKATEDLLYTTLYSIGDAVISTDGEGGIRMMNPIAERMTGWEEKNAKGKPLETVFNVIDRKTRDKIGSPFQRVLKGGDVISLSSDTLLISKEGKEMPISDSGAPIKDSDGNIQGVILVFRDNTLEFESKRLVNESKTRLTRAELASLSGNWELDLNTGKIIGSEGSQKIYGVHDEVIENDVVKSIPLPEYREALDKTLENLIEKKEPYDLEIKIKAADTGEIKNVHTTAFFDEEKNVVFGVIQDITKRKKAEEALKESERRYRTLFDFGRDAIFIHPFDNGGFRKFMEVNKIACERLEYTREELLKLTVKDIAAEKEAIVKETDFGRKELLETGKMIFETKLISKTGKKIPVEIRTTLVNFKNVKAFFSVARDISERKKSEAVLRERMIELERFNKVMVGRELRIIALKKEINNLLKKLGEPKKFKVT